MRYETGTFELRDNEIMMRELTSDETNEVAGGTSGTATVIASLAAGPAAGSSASTTSSGFALSVTNTSAFADIFQTISAVGQVAAFTQSIASVG